MRKIEEVDVGLHVAGGEQLDTERFRGNLFFQLKVALVSEVVTTACLVVCGACLFGCRLAGVLLEHGLLGTGNEFVLLLYFSFLCNLADAGMRIEYGLQFHI